MFFLSHIHHVCYFSILIRLLNGYLLFAANLEDFRAIAKKLVPETMAERLTRIMDKPAMRDKLDDSDLENTEEESTEIDNDSLPPIKGKTEKHPPIKGMKEMQKAKEIFELSSGTKVDFDELVERVKKRLTVELKQTYLDNIRKEADSKRFNEKNKQINDKLLLNNDNNDKVYSHSKYNKNFATHNTKLNKENVKKQKSQYLKDSFNVEEMTPFADSPDYKEDIFNKPKVKHKTKTTKTVIEPDDYEDAMNSPLKYSKVHSVYKGNKNVSPGLENPSQNKKVVQELEPTIPSDLYKKMEKTKTVIEPDDYEDAMNSPLKYSNSVYKGDKNVSPGLENPSQNKKVFQELKPTIPSDLYKKMDLTQHDSYEDYVTPAKQNIYASSENKQNRNSDESKQTYVPNHKRYKIETNRNSLQKNFNNNGATLKAKDSFNTNERDFEKSHKNYDYTERNVESEEIKAKTENLWYDNYERVTEETLISSQTSKKPRHGTGLPTRHTYKMVTPNFVANFPVVAEKYNFDEPIPEKDRERETLKYIGNPPARINKKIRLT